VDTAFAILKLASLRPRCMCVCVCVCVCVWYVCICVCTCGRHVSHSLNFWLAEYTYMRKKLENIWSKHF